MGRGPTDARVPESWSLAGPSLVGTAVETVGLTLGLLGLNRLEGRFSDPCPLYGKRVQSAREDEPFDAILVGEDRDRWRVSRDVTWRCVVASSEIEADGCSSRIRRPYKTTGFAPRVPYFAFSPSHRQPPPPIARASRTRIMAAVKLASTSQPLLNSHPPPSQSFQWSHGVDPASRLIAWRASFAVASFAR